MNFAIAKISTKGQIVIPNFLRKNIESGDEFLMIEDNDRIILKNMKTVAEALKEDVLFAKRVEKAWKKYEKGKFVSKSKKDFLNELKSC
jgi:AbrB family looped-hinge helix DNA binding protein